MEEKKKGNITAKLVVCFIITVSVLSIIKANQGYFYNIKNRILSQIEEIDWDKNKLTDSEKYENEDKLYNFIKEGNDYREKNENRKAIASYDKALIYYKQRKSENKHKLLYLHYGKLSACNDLIYFTAGISEEEKKKYKLIGIEEAYQCLEVFSTRKGLSADEKELNILATTFASNYIAWIMYETENSKEKLEEALAIINQGSELADKSKYYNGTDTRVRILLKLKRKEEAFQIVKVTLDQNPEISDFQDFKTNKEYKEWLASL